MMSRTRRCVPAAFSAWVAITLVATTSAWASVIVSSPSLPVLGVSYSSATGAGCFPAAGVCAAPGTFIPTALVSSTFDASGQDIVTDVTFFGTLTTLASVPIGPFSLVGTMEQLVEGRTSDAELGTWVTDLVALSLTGIVLGHTLTLTLDPSNPSTGSTSMLLAGDGPQSLRFDSFFDVFVELTLDTTPPLETRRGPIRVTLVSPVPEPASLALLLLGVTGLAWRRRRGA